MGWNWLSESRYRQKKGRLEKLETFLNVIVNYYSIDKSLEGYCETQKVTRKTALAYLNELGHTKRELEKTHQELRKAKGWEYEMKEENSSCPNCQNNKTVKNEMQRAKQRCLCQLCGKTFY